MNVPDLKPCGVTGKNIEDPDQLGYCNSTTRRVNGTNVYG